MKNRILFLLCAMLPFVAVAQDSIECSHRLDEFVLSASRWCQDKESQPVKIARLSFEKSNAFLTATFFDFIDFVRRTFR